MNAAGEKAEDADLPAVACGFCLCWDHRCRWALFVIEWVRLMVAREHGCGLSIMVMRIMNVQDMRKQKVRL